MPKKKPKSTNSLMKYLRDNKGIDISSSQKRKLMNMGYYHGYKGYRYINRPSNQISYSKFEELVAIYDFDAQLKALFYPSVMLIETALKNYVLEVIVDSAASENFIDIYTQLLDNHKMFSTTGKTYPTTKSRNRAEEKFKKELKKRLDLRNAIAHNDVVFDTRFRTHAIDGQVSNAISNATGISNLTFETITDYLILIIYQLKLLKVSKTEMKHIISDYIEITEKLRTNIPITIYNQIIHTNNNHKILMLKNYISS